MRVRALWAVPLTLYLLLGVLAWLATSSTGLGGGLVLGFWLVIAVGLVVRVVRARRDVHEGLAPVVDGIERVQDIYLARERHEVVYGPDDADLTLVVDSADPDPGDLRGSTGR